MRILLIGEYSGVFTELSTALKIKAMMFLQYLMAMVIKSSLQIYYLNIL